MKTLSLMTVASIALGVWTGGAAADPWKDESGNGRWLHGRYYHERPYKRSAYKEEYRRGGCKIERKWDDDEYKEEIKCKRGWRPPGYGYYRY